MAVTPESGIVAAPFLFRRTYAPAREMDLEDSDALFRVYRLTMHLLLIMKYEDRRLTDRRSKGFVGVGPFGSMRRFYPLDFDNVYPSDVCNTNGAIARYDSFRIPR